MPNITEEKWIEMLEKKADGTYIAKYPKVKSKSGITFDEHLAETATETKLGHVKAKTKADGTLIIPINIPDGNIYNAVLEIKDVTKLIATSDNYGGIINVIAVDDNYVYVGGSSTNKVQKLNKTDLSLVAESASYGGTIHAIAVDDTYIYVGGLSTKTVKKLNKTDLSQVAESANYGGNIYTINQDIPINGAAYINITLDMSGLTIEIRELIDILSKLDNIIKVDLVAVE